MLAQDPAQLTGMDAARKMRCEAIATAVLAVQVQAIGDSMEDSSLLSHEPRKIEVIRSDRVERLVHATGCQGHGPSPAQEMLDRRSGPEVLGAHVLTTPLHGTDLRAARIDDPP